ncbi:hypothetical protein ACFFJI_04130 [Allobacillus sp. GCM10007491]|uniref:Lipoprotein n=1 Tax=Allobacillus saliphilus TaxID=2912308 RepID=A0A941CU36_9BACI|nr:hypothetical protein [Allobacillus saliphilus]MBR7553963.1 hypothetical protein [Allobacillus saliphilus]
MKRIVGALLLLSVLFLAACNGGDDKSEKEQVVEAFKNTVEATSFESVSNVDINLEGNFSDPTVDPYLQMINDMEISFDSIYDKEAGKQQVTFNLSGQMAPMSINLSVPFLQDLESEKIYIRTDSLVENFGMMFPLPQELNGKLLEVDLAELEQAQGTEEQLDPEELSAQAQKIITDIINEKNEDDFSKDDDVYTIQLTKEDLISLIEKSGELSGDALSGEEIEQMRADLEEAAEQTTIHKSELQLTIDDDLIKNQTFVADVEVSENGEDMRIGLTLDTTYKNINGDVEFSINPEEEEIITPEELQMFQMQGF